MDTGCDSVCAMANAGVLLREARRRSGLSQRALALRAGSKQANISRIEAGAESITVERLERLLAVMGLRLTVQVEPLEHDLDADDLAAACALTPEERLRESMSW